ncbi:M1 family metallopeptidase [Mariniflexile gromovii]|uniref:Aminopeptidase N n=1 Tax=Mariniflexile gromovii TaxID=362523 RepID=A0ABS4BPQ1_9FLAO|nr:M1 family metallopeptidase [Mariniflexile gromovii]MBP0902573.1 M1 family metallopeptidase [Mariniflexile gromovii]
MIRILLVFFFFVNFIAEGQQADYVDFKKAKAAIAFGDLSKKEVGGTITYEFEILQNTDSVYVDAVAFSEIKYVLDETIAGSLYNGKHLIIKHPFKANTNHKVTIAWKTSPKKAMYFIDWGFEEGNKQIWTQGQGKYTSNWLPSFDDMSEKVEFDLSIEFDKNYQVIANGKLTNQQINESTITWHYDMQKPMSSYLVALAIGKYKKKVEKSKSGVPLEMYYYPEDSLKLEPTYRYTKPMFNFLEEEIGVKYPWQNYKQVPVKDFLYAGMENTSTTIFADSYVIDSIAFVDKNYVNVNAHELAHQWFGNLVTETSGTHHWLQEGFATYYALLAEKEVFGEDYYYWQLYEYAQELLEQDTLGQNTSLLDPKSSSTTFYKKGAWVLHMLREQVGDKAFKTAIKNYLINYQFKNVETDDFIREVEKASGKNLAGFVDDWLNDKSFNYSKCYDILKNSSQIISKLDVLESELLFSSHSPNFSLNRFIDKATYSEIKKLIFSKELITLVEDYDIYIKAFSTKDLKVRQAIAINLTEIPSELREDYETLLNDKSYITIEKALFNLWLNFPQERSKYLNKTKGIEGFNDKNIRILWLALALVTEAFEPENKKQYFDELNNYTNPNYNFEIRQNAFLYLQQINACNSVCIENLKQATTHHSWQFSKFAKVMLEQINTYKK